VALTQELEGHGAHAHHVAAAVALGRATVAEGLRAVGLILQIADGFGNRALQPGGRAAGRVASLQRLELPAADAQVPLVDLAGTRIAIVEAAGGLLPLDD